MPIFIYFLSVKELHSDQFWILDTSALICHNIIYDIYNCITLKHQILSYVHNTKIFPTEKQHFS